MRLFITVNYPNRLKLLDSLDNETDRHINRNNK